MTKSFPSYIIPLVLAAVGLTCLPSAILAQTTRQANARSRYYTPYMRSYGVPYYNNYRQVTPGYVPPRVTAPALPPVTGTVERYSPVEYGEIVKMAVEAARRNSPIPAQTTTTRLTDLATSRTATGETIYEPVSTRVSQVLDRGILLLPTGEEIRLRGVFMPSQTDTNDVLRLYAREGIQVLSNLTSKGEVYVLLDEPLRDEDGRILATVLLPDGTELNRRMLELGYGSTRAEDFGPGVDFSDLTAAQDSARQQRVGIWSR